MHGAPHPLLIIHQVNLIFLRDICAFDLTFTNQCWLVLRIFLFVCVVLGLCLTHKKTKFHVAKLSPSPSSTKLEASGTSSIASGTSSIASVPSSIASGTSSIASGTPTRTSLK
jgi:hypothetical protein